MPLFVLWLKHVCCLLRRPGEKQYITEFVSSDAAGAAGDDFMGGSNAAR
jgi:hypothetical protein